MVYTVCCRPGPWKCTKTARRWGKWAAGNRTEKLAETHGLDLLLVCAVRYGGPSRARADGRPTWVHPLRRREGSVAQGEGRGEEAGEQQRAARARLHHLRARQAQDHQGRRAPAAGAHAAGQAHAAHARRHRRALLLAQVLPALPARAVPPHPGRGEVRDARARRHGLRAGRRRPALLRGAARRLRALRAGGEGGVARGGHADAHLLAVPALRGRLLRRAVADRGGRGRRVAPRRPLRHRAGHGRRRGAAHAVAAGVHGAGVRLREQAGGRAIRRDTTVARLQTTALERRRVKRAVSLDAPEALRHQLRALPAGAALQPPIPGAGRAARSPD
jgi:hypothetical protein